MLQGGKSPSYGPGESCVVTSWPDLERCQFRGKNVRRGTITIRKGLGQKPTKNGRHCRNCTKIGKAGPFASECGGKKNGPERGGRDSLCPKDRVWSCLSQSTRPNGEGYWHDSKGKLFSKGGGGGETGRRNQHIYPFGVARNSPTKEKRHRLSCRNPEILPLRRREGENRAKRWTENSKEPVQEKKVERRLPR